MQINNRKIKYACVILELSLVITLLVIWLGSETIRESRNLWILFLYSFPSHFCIAVVPHEPVLLYFGKFYSPALVTIAAISGVVLTEFLNYSFISIMSSYEFVRTGVDNKYVKKLVGLFNKIPFTALLIAGFSPVPFYPFRFLAVFSHYPLIKYISAVFISRSFRFYILAYAGYLFDFSNSVIIMLFVVLIIIAIIPLLKQAFTRVKSRIRTVNN
ncbi:VTT domain-containing protein [candidate division KSB1 bacterium]